MDRAISAESYVKLPNGDAIENMAIWENLVSLRETLCDVIESETNSKETCK